MSSGRWRQNETTKGCEYGVQSVLLLLRRNHGFWLSTDAARNTRRRRHWRHYFPLTHCRIESRPVGRRRRFYYRVAGDIKSRVHLRSSVGRRTGSSVPSVRRTVTRGCRTQTVREPRTRRRPRLLPSSSQAPRTDKTSSGRHVGVTVRCADEDDVLRAAFWRRQIVAR